MLVVGETIRAFCCDICARRANVTPKAPADSGVESWPCEVCGHYNIGSYMQCKVGNWLVLTPQSDTNPRQLNEQASAAAQKDKP